MCGDCLVKEASFGTGDWSEEAEECDGARQKVGNVGKAGVPSVALECMTAPVCSQTLRGQGSRRQW